MNCFHHNSASAVGICKSCNKGLCIECAVDVQNGIACRNSCEDEVRSLNYLIEESSQVRSKGEKLLSAISPLGGVMFSLGTGLVFLYFAYESEKMRPIALVGILFIAQALFAAYRYWFKKYPDDRSD